MIFGQDKSMFTQHLLKSKQCVGPQGQRLLLPKTDGLSLVISALQSRETGAVVIREVYSSQSKDKDKKVRILHLVSLTRLETGCKIRCLDSIYISGSVPTRNTFLSDRILYIHVATNNSILQCWYLLSYFHDPRNWLIVVILSSSNSSFASNIYFGVVISSEIVSDAYDYWLLSQNQHSADEREDYDLD